MPGGFIVRRDLRYGAQQRQALDVYLPQPIRRSAPVVMFIYGGGWEDGSRSDYYFLGAALASRGYLTVIPDYRLWPQIRFPAFLEDCAAALRWSRDHAASLGGDPARLMLMGHSAGAYNAAMLSLDTRWLRAVAMDPRRDVSGMIGLAGPYDFLPLDSDMLRDLFGPPDQLPLTQPINFVTPDAPPMFLAAGSADRTVDPGNTRRLAAKARAVGATVREAIYPGVDHRTLIGAIAAPLRFLAPTLHDCLGFLGRVTQGEQSG